MAFPVALLCCILLPALVSAILLVARGQPAPGDRDSTDLAREQFVPLPQSLTFPDAADVELLRKGQPITGRLRYKQAKLLRFGLTRVENEGFPDVVIWLRTTNRNGNANLKCAPWKWAMGAEMHFGQKYPWQSNNSRVLEAVFLPSVSKEYEAAVTNVNVTRDEGEEEEVPVAAFVCQVLGVSKTGSEFELRMDTTLGGVRLIEEERDAVREIANQCCFDEELCRQWPGPAATERAGGEEDEQDELHVSTNLCHVPGNVCNLEGRLVKLNMRGYNLSCAFPTEQFGAFASLQILDASGNQFGGAVDDIGAALAGTANLTHIDLSSCGLGGSLSGSEGLCELVSNGVEVLSLRDNDIEGSVPECLLAEGSALLQIDLSTNAIMGSLPDVLESSSRLESLIIASTEISGTIPGSLAEAQSLSFVDLTNNGLTGAVPENLESLPVLDHFNVSGNELDTLPNRWSDPEIEISDSLSVLDVSLNLLEGGFPIGLGRAKNLAWLNMANNNLGGFLPSEEGLFPGLRYLNVSSNFLSGSIPDSWQTFGIFTLQFILPDFGKLDARNNSLSGVVPSFLFTDSPDEHRKRAVYLEGNDVSCPSLRAALPLVDVCPGLEEEVEDGPIEDMELTPQQMETEREVEAALAADGENGTDSTVTEEEIEEADAKERERELEAIENNEDELAEIIDQVEGADRKGGDSSSSDIAAAVISGLFGGFVFALILGFIFYWRRRRHATRTGIKHERMTDDVEMSQGL